MARILCANRALHPDPDGRRLHGAGAAKNRQVRGEPQTGSTRIPIPAGPAATLRDDAPTANRTEEHLRARLENQPGFPDRLPMSLRTRAQGRGITRLADTSTARRTAIQPSRHSRILPAWR
jgi:hypothetical protein